ncbi:uncharacterized protein [Panulirus ornatus]|uniref:uncharacterized protein n=1 Tax=Panulirus ornatus TaxID=150431 RepID=UPI003A8C49F7
MGSADSPDRCRQPVERGAREGAPTATLEDHRVTTTGAGTQRDLPVWLRIMKSSAAQCSVPSQAPVPQPPIRSSSKLEAITTGIRESASAHNGTNMPKTLPKKYSLPAGLAQAGDTQLCPTPKWLLTDKAEQSHHKDGIPQELPAVEESCYDQKEATQEVAALAEPFYKQKWSPQTVSATDKPCQSKRDSSETVIATAGACYSQKESPTATTDAEPSPCQKVPSQAVAPTPILSHRHKEPLMSVTVKGDPCPTHALNVTAKPFCKEKGSTQMATAMAESVLDRKDPYVVIGARTIHLEKETPQVFVGSAETCHSHKAPPQAVTTTVDPCSQRGPSQAVTDAVEPCSQEGPSQALSTSAGTCSQRGPSQAMTATAGSDSQIRPSQVVTKSAEFSHSQKAKPQAVTALADPCSSQGGPSKAVTTSLEYSRDQEESSQVVAARLEPQCGQTGPSQAVGATAEPHQRQQTETVTNKDYLEQREPSQAENSLKEEPSHAETPIKTNQKGPSQEVATADDLHNQIQPFQTVNATTNVCLSQARPSEAMSTTNEVCRSQAGPPEAVTATKDVCHSQRESVTQPLDMTTMTTRQCPPKSSTSDTQPSFASSTSEVPLSRDLDLTYPPTSLSSVPSHHHEAIPDVGSFPSSDAFDSAIDSCSPGLDRIREILCMEEKGIYTCDEPRQDLDRTSENTERVEETDLVRSLSSCLSGSIVQEKTSSLSGEDDVTMRDKAAGGVVAKTKLGERQVDPGSREEGLGVGQESCGTARGLETNEQAASVASRVQMRPRSTRFPLDIICGTKISCQRDDEQSPSRLPRQRLSSVDHVQLLAPGPAHENNSSRSKSTSRIGSRTTDAAEGAVLHTLAFDAFGKGAKDASVVSNPENVTTSSPLVFPPPILPLDTVLENKIKLTIDSCTVNQVDGNTIVPPGALLPEAGTLGSVEDSEASQSGDVTSHLSEVGRSDSDAPTHCIIVNKTLPELLKDVSVKDDAIYSSTVIPREAVDDVGILGNKKEKETEEIHLKGDVLVDDVCSGDVEDVREDVSSGHLKENHWHVPPPPHSSSRSQDSTRTKVLPTAVSDSVARVVAGLMGPAVQPEGDGADVKKPHTSVIQDEELAARREGLPEQGRQDMQQHQYSLGILSCGQLQEQQQQEECKVSEEEEGEDVSTVLVPTTGLSLEMPPHQPDPMGTEEPSHVTDSSGRTSLLVNQKPGPLYTDECESGPDMDREAPREVSENILVDGQEEFDEMEKSGCSLTEVEGGLRGQNGEDVTRPSLQSFSFPHWIQTLDEKCTVNTAESLLEGAITLRIGSHDEQRVDSCIDELQQPLCVVVEGTVESPPVVKDNAESPPAESGEHGTATMREESVEEYEQALEVVTPEPSHGFSQSSASVATVVRVDTPCDTHTHLPPEDEEAEEEFVDASDSMDLGKGDAELVEEVAQGEHDLDTFRSSPTLAHPVSLVGATPQEEAMTRTLSMTTSDTQSSGTSHTSSVDMYGTRSADVISNPAVSTLGSVSELVCQHLTQQPVITGRRGSDMPEDGSTSSGGHITDPDMLASASASSTGSETWWTSGGGPVGQRDLLPLDKDEDEAQWRALLAVNLPDTEEEPTGYESDEDFDAVDADMRRLEEKLRIFERELGQNSEEDPAAKNGEKTSPAAVPSEDLGSLQISSLPQVFPAVSSAKTKHLSLMTRLEVQEYEDSTSESDSESEAASSSDSADFLFVKTKIKLKPGDRKCRSLDEKRSKNYTLNKSREDKRRSSRVKENSCVCEEQLDLSNMNLHLGTVVEEVVSDGREEAQITSVAAKETVSIIPPVIDEPEECSAPAQPADPHPADLGQLVTGGEDANGVMLCGGEDHLLLGYIWHEEDGMAAVDFEGLEDFKNFEGQGALMIMYEDDHEDKLNDDDVMTGPPGGLPEYLAEESECESSWSRGSSCGASVSSPHQSSKGLEKTFLAAFKSSLRKASKYLGPKMESRSRKKGDQSPAMSQDSSELVDSTHLTADLPYQGRRCSVGVDDDSSAGVYNVQSGRVAPVSAIPTSDSEGPEAMSCSSGEYYAAPALCVNTSDEDPAAVSALARSVHLQQPQDPSQDVHRSVHNRSCDTSGPPPMPPPRWVQRRSYVPQNLDAGLLNQCLSSSSEGHGRSAAATLSQPQPTPQPSLRTTSQKVTYSPPTSATHVHSPVERFTNGKETHPCVVGVPSNAPGEGETCQPFVAPGLSVRLAEDGEPTELGALPPLPAPPLYADDTSPGGSWLPHGYPHFTMPNHGNYSCVVPSHRHLRGDADLPVDAPLHIDDASPTVPSRKPVSVKQLKRKQQEKVLHREAEEGLEALGCTYCMGVPQMRGRPPEDVSHWRQSSPHPRAISDRRSWPPRK